MFCKPYLHLRGQAIRLNVATHKLNDLFRGCARPETALDAHRLDGRNILVRQNTTGCEQGQTNLGRFTAVSERILRTAEVSGYGDGKHGKIS